MRVPRKMRVIDGRPVDECVYQVYGSLRDIGVHAGVTDDVRYAELKVDRDEYGLDRNVEDLCISYSIEWSETNVMASQGILNHIERAILDILDEYDPDANVVRDLQVVLIIGGQHTGRVFDRVTRERGEPWIDPPIKRAIVGKDPFAFD